MLGYFELDSNLAAHPNRETHRNDFFVGERIYSYSYFLLTMYNPTITIRNLLYIKQPKKV